MLEQEKDKYWLYIGRFSPFHEGHKTIIDSALTNGKNVCIAIRDTPLTKKDPFSATKRKLMIREIYSDKKRVKIIIIPDLETVAIGREVGYTLLEVPDNIKIISGTKTREQKELPFKNKPEGLVIWFWGLASTGKSTLSKLLFDELRKLDFYNIILLDADQIRSDEDNNDFSVEGRTRHIDNLRSKAIELSNDSSIIIVAATTPFEAMHIKNNELITNYIDIYLYCSLEEAKKRDTKGIYKAFDEGLITQVCGLDFPFDEPDSILFRSDLWLDTERSISDCINTIIKELVDDYYL